MFCQFAYFSLLGDPLPMSASEPFHDDGAVLSGGCGLVYAHDSFPVHEECVVLHVSLAALFLCVQGEV